MARFRRFATWTTDLQPVSIEDVRAFVDEALDPRHFFAHNGLTLAWEHLAAEDNAWEIYKGRLLDSSQTRERRTFEAWNVFAEDESGRSTEPLLSLKLDVAAGQLHIVRAIYCYAWEGYDAGGNVYLSRETRKWLRELACTIEFSRVSSVGELRQEIICGLFQAVVGTSRLPLTSVEAPLPAFSLGRLAYFYHSGPAPLRTWRDLADETLIVELTSQERGKLLETVLHAIPSKELAEAGRWMLDHLSRVERGVLLRLERIARRRARRLTRLRGTPLWDSALASPEQIAKERWWIGWYQRERQGDPATLGYEALFLDLRTMFNDAALSPYTDLVDKTLALLRSLEATGCLPAEEVVDFLGQLLRQLCRHLTAYDLITFHHRGANYPDALVLDAVLKAYLDLIEREPALCPTLDTDTDQARFLKVRRRRALRQAWLLRCFYEGHPVPDAPTSPGENARVLPPPHVRVPEEQIVRPDKRTKRLFAGDPLEQYLGEQARSILKLSIQDLHDPVELRELGMALFLDRPLGGGKGPPEPDQTPLLSYLAFSRSIARSRLRYLTKTLGLNPDLSELETLEKSLDALVVHGIPVADVARSARPAIISLADAAKAADDFVILRNTSRSWSDFDSEYLLSPKLNDKFSMDELRFGEPVLLLRDKPTVEGRERLVLYDGRLRKRVELDFDVSQGYVRRGGVEYPASPLRVIRVWESTARADELREHDLTADPIQLRICLF
jgi:hypothetical protein